MTAKMIFIVQKRAIDPGLQRHEEAEDLLVNPAAVKYYLWTETSIADDGM